MLDFPRRQRPMVLLAIVVTAQVLLLAAQIRREGDQMRLIRWWAVLAMTPLQRAGTSVIDGIGGAWNHYVDLRGARHENEALLKEVADLKIRVQQLESRAAEAGRLAQLLAFREEHAGAELLAARVIAASPAGASQTITIDRGESDGVRADMGVMTPDGVVGKVLVAHPNAALVLLMTDGESGVGARLANSRVNGVVRGKGEPILQMEHVSRDQEVAAGESIVTSGLDRIFPRDLPVGTVLTAEPGKGSNLSKVITLRPAAKLDRLEEVFVLLTRKEWETKKEAESASVSAGGKAPVQPQ